MKTCREFDNRRELWRSEMLMNDLDPVWKSTFVHEYRFEESQPIKIEIYDWDTSDSGVTNHLKDQENKKLTLENEEMQKMTDLQRVNERKMYELS